MVCKVCKRKEKGKDKTPAREFGSTFINTYISQKLEVHGLLTFCKYSLIFTTFFLERGVIFVGLTAGFHFDLRCCVLFNFIFYILPSWLFSKTEWKCLHAEQNAYAKPVFPCRVNRMFSADVAIIAISKIREQLSLYVETIPFFPILRVKIQHLTLYRLLF